METMSVKKIIFLVFFLALFIVVARLYYPFLTVMLWSALIYIILDPLYERVIGLSRSKRERPWSRRLVAGAFSLLGVLIIVVPVVFLAINVAKQVSELTSAAIRFLDSHPEYFDLSPQGMIGGFLYRATDGSVNLSSIDLKGEIMSFIAGSGGRIFSLSSAAIRNGANVLISLAFMIFTLYFFFMDGRTLVRVLVGAIPIDKTYTTLFMRTLKDTSKQLIVGYLFVSLYQAIAAFVIFRLFGVQGPLVLALLTAMAAFIPMLGASLIWLPVGVARLATGDIAGGIALLLISGFFISTVDNFLRPMLLKQRLNVHPLLIFFAILGGLKLFGLNGLILGPLILILFFTALGLFDKSYRPGEEGEVEGVLTDGSSERGGN
jgi:predicted PurR-regulated permease PerM